MGVFDFLLDWDIATLILAAAILTVVVLAGSYGMALGWRRWKDAQRRRRIAERRGGAPGEPAKQAGRAGSGVRSRGRGLAGAMRKAKPGARDAPPTASSPNTGRGPRGAAPEEPAPAAGTEGPKGPRVALSRLRRRT